MDILDFVKHIFPNVIQSGNTYTTPCVKLYIDIIKKFMVISNINKCDEDSGNITIQKVIELGRLLKENNGINDIRLTDASIIYLDGDCTINMSIYFILSTGISWYNRAGFRSLQHDTEVTHNEEIRSLNISEYVKKCWIEKNLTKLDSMQIQEEAKEKIKQQILVKSEPESKEFTDQFFTEFPEFDHTMSIGYIFSVVKESKIIEKCVGNRSKLLIKLVNCGFYLFEYENDLVLVL
jgi:hypothetical protein